MAWTRLGSQIVAQATDADVELGDLQLGLYYAITSYRDIEDVLRLDPLHDFNEHGWPNRA